MQLPLSFRTSLQHKALSCLVLRAGLGTLKMSSDLVDSLRPSLQAAYFPRDALWDPSWIPAAGEATIQQRMKTALNSNEDDDSDDVTLYCSWFCPFAQRAWIALEETGVHYRYQEINPYVVDPAEPGGYTKQALPLEEKRRLHPGFVEASPRGLAPAVRRRQHAKEVDEVVWESLPVVEYVDAVFGTSSRLVPQDPHERAMVQIWSAHCTDRIQKSYYGALMAQTDGETKTALKQFFDECRTLAHAMSDDGPFFLGNRFGIVDVALAPFWQRMIWVGGHYMGLEFPQNDEAFNDWRNGGRQRRHVRAWLRRWFARKD